MVFRSLITLGFMLAVFIVSATPGHPQPDDSAFVWLLAGTPSSIQKIGHLLVYGLLAWLWWWTLEGLALPSRYRLLTAFLVTTGYGAFNEWYQTQVPGRFGSVLDTILNALGAALGLFIAGPWLS